MPVHERLLCQESNRFLAVRGDVSLRRLLHHAAEACTPLWWVLLVWSGDGVWRAGLLADAFAAPRKDPAWLDRPVADLPGVREVECHERSELTTEEAKYRARLAPANVVVILDGGGLAGVVRQLYRSAPVLDAEVPAAEEPLGDGLLAQSGEDGRPVAEKGAGSEERFTDVLCPRQVWRGTPRFAAVLRLTRSPEERDDRVQRIWVNPGDILVELQAPGVELLGSPRQRIQLVRSQDSTPAVFYMAPSQVGDMDLTFDLFQGGHHLQTISVPVRITADPVTGPEQESAPASLCSRPTVPPPDRVLLVSHDRSSRSLLFQLIAAGGTDTRDFHPLQVDVSPEALTANLFTEILGLQEPFTRPEGETLCRRLEALGRHLWRELLPGELQELYAEQREEWRDRSLLILSDEPYIPWEMVWPYGAGWEDEEPWCLSLRLSRWLRRDPKGRGNAGAPGRVPFRRLACIVPRGDLDAARRERGFLASVTQQHHLRDVSPPQATWREVMRCLEAGDYDWLHAAAHGSFHPVAGEARGVLWLEDGQTLTPEHLADCRIEEHLGAARPGFVLNACDSGRLGWGFSGMAGWAHRLVSDGASLFLAPLWEVGDNSALILVRQLYARLLAGDTVSEACREARRAARAAGDATWLAYSLYCHPNAKLDSGGSLTPTRTDDRPELE